MTVSRGREFLSIPGPTNIPDAVLAAMHRPAIDIYAGDMLAVTQSLLEDLPKIFRDDGAHLHPRRERPRRLGGRAHQRVVAGREAPSRPCSG
jgi:hypothetical protein